jgi:hypothetical protein
MTDANNEVELQAILAEYTDKMSNISTDIDEADQIALKNEAFRIFTEKAAEINKTKSNQSVSSSPLVGSSTTTIVAEAATKIRLTSVTPENVARWAVSKLTKILKRLWWTNASARIKILVKSQNTL